MKIIVSSFLLTVLIINTSFRIHPIPHIDVYKLNSETSSLEWNAKKVGGEHYGSINFISGTLKNDHGNYSGTFEIDMTSIVVTDKSSFKGKLEKHLKSDDFFDIKNHPVSKLSIISMKKVSTETGEIYKLEGQLTIKGITHPVAFDSDLKKENNTLKFTGDMVIDRTKYDIKYKSAKYFPDIGDKMIYDDFTLKFDVALQK